MDKNFNIYSYQLLLSVVNYQSAILNDDMHGAEVYFKDVPEAQYTKLARFLEANDRKAAAEKVELPTRTLSPPRRRLTPRSCRSERTR